MNTRLSTKFRGFTLVELMIVVAILGILASISVYVYGKYIKKARASEIPQVFGEFKIREEAFHAEMGRYIGAPGGENDMHPTTIMSDRTDAVTGRPAYWTQLRIRLSKTALYCQYSATAGPAGDATNRGVQGSTLWSGTLPTSDWFYLRAICNFDGNAAVNSQYLQRGDDSALHRDNEGR